MICKRCHSEIHDLIDNRCEICGIRYSDEEINYIRAAENKERKLRRRKRNRITTIIVIVVILGTLFGIFHKQIINYIKTEQYKTDYATFKTAMADKKEAKRIEKERKEQEKIALEKEKALQKENEIKAANEEKARKEAEEKRKKEEEAKAKSEEERRIAEEKLAKKREAALEKKYKIGKLGEGGGVIFYDKGEYSDGWRYLECSVSNIANDYWCSEQYQQGFIEGLRSGLGNGDYNTDLIISAVGYKSAAGLARKYKGGGHKDWYLPNRDEMILCYKMLGKKYYRRAKKIAGWEPVRKGILGIFTDPYNFWTSELETYGSAYYINCEGKFAGDPTATEMYSKDLMFGLVTNPKNYIRAIRKF